MDKIQMEFLTDTLLPLRYHSYAILRLYNQGNDKYIAQGLRGPNYMSLAAYYSPLSS